MNISTETPSPTQQPPRIGLALSGGGYRAAAFHLGTLNKLHQMRILPQVSVISTISGGAKKQIAYLSLGWDAGNCIDGFIKNLKKEQITAEVIQAHQLPAAWVDDPDSNYESLMTYLQGRVNQNQLQLPTKDEKELARSVGTNLTALSKAKVDALMKQAEVLTEIQVRLYCPTIAPALPNLPPIPTPTTPAPQPA